MITFELRPSIPRLSGVGVCEIIARTIGQMDAIILACSSHLPRPPHRRFTICLYIKAWVGNYFTFDPAPWPESLELRTLVNGELEKSNFLLVKLSVAENCSEFVSKIFCPICELSGVTDTSKYRPVWLYAGKVLYFHEIARLSLL